MLDRSWGYLPPPPPPPRRGLGTELIVGIVVLLMIVGATGWIVWQAHPEPTVRRTPAPSGRPSASSPAPGSTGEPSRPTLAGQSSGSAVIAGSAPAAWDPARVRDAGSAAILSQIDESLTVLDEQNRVQPALAASWSVTDGGRSITFQLRPGIAFSDGTPITPEDVRRSWLHVLDPDRPSPLASLLADITGATAYANGSGSADEVGIEAQSNAVTVHFRHPASYFASTVSSPTLAIMPPLPNDASGPELPAGLVVSGAYIPQTQSDSAIQLTANPMYWAGPPPIRDITVTTSLGGASPVDAFQADHVDDVPIAPDDASWIRYDAQLGPQLRQAMNLSVAYYGFTVTDPPFDNVNVRRAFAMAVNWDRIVTLDDPTAAPATSLVPLGIEGRGTTDYSPSFDVTRAKQALATAGYPDGNGFPAVTLTSLGGTDEEAVASELQQNLGITVHVEETSFDEYSASLDTDPPAFWTLDWVADYPHPQDFLGLLLTSDSRSNVGRWSNSQFDAAIERAASTADPRAQEQAYGDAQRIVQDQVPVIPLRYGVDWALSRNGLLGAQENGVGFVRFAGLAWANP